MVDERAYEERQAEGGGSMAGNGGRTRGKGFVRLTHIAARTPAEKFFVTPNRP